MADPAVAGAEPEVIGPAPAPVVKVNNRFRYRVTLVGKNERAVRERVAWLLKAFAQCREHRGLSVFADCNTME